MKPVRALVIAACTTLTALASCSEKAPPPPPPPPPAPVASAALLTPDTAKLSAAGPDSFVVTFTTSRGPFDVKVHRAWAPRGADRLYYLASNGFYDGARFYRVIGGFMAQFGANGKPAVDAAWENLRIPDDPVKHSNVRGTLTFATSGKNSRTTHMFINFGNNARLDASGFSALGQVTGAGMKVVDSLFGGYGEGAPDGQGPTQGRIGAEGNVYLARDFPKLDSIVTAKVTGEWKKKEK
jgi:peptidyl-prolyl cis-trans isomerase A (cyclophilin A)